MNFCRDGHEKICFEGTRCPACEIKEELEGQIVELKNLAAKIPENLIALRFQDRSDPEIYYSVVLSTSLSEAKLTKEIEKIIQKNKNRDWTYDSILKILEAQGKIKVVSTKEILIYC